MEDGVIRWNYVLPRLIGLILVICLLHFGAAPAVRYCAQHAAESATGRKLSIGNVSASIWSGRATLRDVALANVEGEDQSPLSAKEITFDLSMNAALKRRLNVDEASIQGLKLRLDRLDDLCVGQARATLPAYDFSPYFDAAGDWLEGSGASFVKDLESELKSPALVKELSERWPAEWQSLRQEAESIANEAKILKTRAEQLKQNPVRGLAELEDSLNRAFALRDRGAALRARAEKWVANAREDKNLVEAARQHDLLYLKENFGSWQAVDKEKMAGYLVGDSLSGYAAQGLRYVAMVRTLLPYLENTAKPQRVADRCVHFPLYPPLPSLLLSKLIVEGEVYQKERGYPISATLERLTNQPKVLGAATQFRLVSNDHQFPGEIHCEIDHSTNQPRESFTLSLPFLATPAMILGKPEHFAVAVGSGVSQIHGRFLFLDDQVRGEIRLDQQQAQLNPIVSARLGGERLAEPLRTVLGGLGGLTMATELRGPVNKPGIRVATNLDEALSSGLETAVAAELEKGRVLAARKVQQELDAGVAKLEALVFEQQQKLQASLGLSDSELSALAQMVQGRVGGQVSQLAGKLQAKLPDGVKNSLGTGSAGQALQGALRGLVR